MKTLIAACAILAFCGVALANDGKPLTVSDKGHVNKGGAWVCRDVHHIERAAQFGSDDEAFVRYMLPKSINGECRALPVDDPEFQP